MERPWVARAERDAATREILLDPDLIKDGRLRDAVISDTGSGRAGQ